MTVMRRWYLRECFGECLKHIGAVEATVKVDIELGSEVGQMAQLCVCIHKDTIYLLAVKRLPIV